MAQGERRMLIDGELVLAVNVVTSSDHLVGEELTLWPQVDLLVHGLHRGRTPDHGEGCRDDEAAVPRDQSGRLAGGIDFSRRTTSAEGPGAA